MYRTDYIMRTIKQFSEMLAALLFDTRAAGEDVAYKDLDKLSSSFTGFALDALIAMPSSQILTLFSITGQLDINKSYASACLLHQLAKQESSEETKTMLNDKALDLLLEVKTQLGEFLNDEHEALIDGLQASALSS